MDATIANSFAKYLHSCPSNFRECHVRAPAKPGHALARNWQVSAALLGPMRLWASVRHAHAVQIGVGNQDSRLHAGSRAHSLVPVARTATLLHCLSVLCLTRAPFHIHFTLVMMSSPPHFVSHPCLRLSILDLFAMPLVYSHPLAIARLASAFRPSDYKVHRGTFINSSYAYIPFYPFSLSLFDCRSTARPISDNRQGNEIERNGCATRPGLNRA